VYGVSESTSPEISRLGDARKETLGRHRRQYDGAADLGERAASAKDGIDKVDADRAARVGEAERTAGRRRQVRAPAADLRRSVPLQREQRGQAVEIAVVADEERRPSVGREHL